MRIVAGKFKNKSLFLPKGVGIRPTSQKVKQALFNILGDRIVRATFLELFAGSGNIGLEALSRGAKQAYFVEHNRKCIQAIEQNLNSLELKYHYAFKPEHSGQPAAAVILPWETQKAVDLLRKHKQKFELVFLDPPYHQVNLKNTLKNFNLCDILSPQSWVIIEHYQAGEALGRLVGLELVCNRRYGETALSFYQARL
ncbi:MAG: 16S rRNA (guanine(966)-N(2))-methyltransferase RsmD [Candidatus Omnitrophica bacterium]|nr:16S rRNA (guanine(966)-N(2))-methyltransferase RsmD [Candidatus Omnitrophota bacterium]